MWFFLVCVDGVVEVVSPEYSISFADDFFFSELGVASSDSSNDYAIELVGQLKNHFDTSSWRQSSKDLSLYLLRLFACV